MAILQRSPTAVFEAAGDGPPGGRRDVIDDLAWVVGIADVDRPYTGVEPREEHDAPVVDRREVLVRGVSAVEGLQVEGESVDRAGFQVWGLSVR
jgi:hypothetical protein